jgi:hypothetical protein
MIRFPLPPHVHETRDKLERALTSIDPVATGSPSLLWNALVKLAYCDERVLRAVVRAAKELPAEIIKEDRGRGRPRAKTPEYNQMMARFLAAYRYKHGDKATAADAARFLADIEARAEAERALPTKTSAAQLSAATRRKTDQIKTDFARAQANDPATRAFFRCFIDQIVIGTDRQEALRLAGEAAHDAAVITKLNEKTSFSPLRGGRGSRKPANLNGAKNV